MTKDLCSVCRGVFIRCGRRAPDPNPNSDSRGQNFYIHHETSTGLRKAAEEGCQLCAALWRSLTMRERATIVQRDDSPFAGSPVVSYSLSTFKPYFIELRLRTLANSYIEKSFSLRPIQGRHELSDLAIVVSSLCNRKLLCEAPGKQYFH